MNFRQQLILEDVINEFVRTAVPVGSQNLVENYRFDLSPATVRAEMQKLTEGGYLEQPHISAGRIPTDKGYRFFVDDLLEKGDGRVASNLRIEEKIFKLLKKLEKESQDLISFSHQLTKILASFSSCLALTYLLEENVLWKEGWQEIFREPEFKDATYVLKFTKTVNDFEGAMEEFKIENYSEIQVYIGKENPINSVKEFSIILSSFPMFEQRGLLAILGPKRMPYSKNIKVLQNFIKVLKRK